MEESQHELKGRGVFILQVRQSSGQFDPIPFAFENDMHRHLCDLIALQLGAVEDEKLKRQIVLHLELRDHVEVIRLYRQVQLNNKKAPPLDFRWEQGSSVIM